MSKTTKTPEGSTFGQTPKSLGNAYDGSISLNHGKSCTCPSCLNPTALSSEKCYSRAMEHFAENSTRVSDTNASASEVPEAFPDSDAMLDRAIENAIVRGIFGQNDLSRRRFMHMVGGSTLAAALATILPIEAVKAAVKESTGKLEKPN